MLCCQARPWVVLATVTTADDWLALALQTESTPRIARISVPGLSVRCLGQHLTFFFVDADFYISANQTVLSAGD